MLSVGVLNFVVALGGDGGGTAHTQFIAKPAFPFLARQSAPRRWTERQMAAWVCFGSRAHDAVTFLFY
jgi:hypothetical protein